MKNWLMIAAIAGMTVVQAAVLKQVKNLTAGEISVGGGKLAAVEVVSEVASGTVTLSRVVPFDVYTNAVETSIVTDEVAAVSAVATNRFFDYTIDGVPQGSFVFTSDWTFEAVSSMVTNRYFDFYVDGKLVRVFEEGGTNATYNGYTYKDPMFLKSGAWRIMYGTKAGNPTLYWWFLVDPQGHTNAQVLAEYGIGYIGAKEIDFGAAGRAVERKEYVPTSSAAGGKLVYGRDPVDLLSWWYLIDGTGATNAQVRGETGVGFYAHSVNFGTSGLFNERFEYITTYATNTVVSVQTNSVYPVLKSHNAKTNQLCTGTCSGGSYTATPSNGWLFSGDKLLFEGTATGGTLRLVIE